MDSIKPLDFVRIMGAVGKTESALSKKLLLPRGFLAGTLLDFATRDPALLACEREAKRA
jgi:hypothetical protein